MGYLVSQAYMKVALIGADQNLINKISRNINITDAENPGACNVRSYESIDSFLSSGTIDEVTGVCLVIDAIAPEVVTAFVANTRVIAPLVSICLIAKQRFLDELPGYHKHWQEKFGHYYKLASDLLDSDFENNSKVVRDLLLADTIKRVGLGQYTTTPGAVVYISSRPWGFWITIAATFIAAFAAVIVGGISSSTINENSRMTTHETSGE